MRNAIQERAEAVGVTHPLPQGSPIGVVGAADATLVVVEFIGTRLALVQPEAGIRLRPVWPG